MGIIAEIIFEIIDALVLNSTNSWRFFLCIFLAAIVIFAIQFSSLQPTPRLVLSILVGCLGLAAGLFLESKK